LPGPSTLYQEADARDAAAGACRCVICFPEDEASASPRARGEADARSAAG
jgi:hypothetical protein